MQVDKAMRYLKRVRADSPAYVKAQLVKAAVFLKQRRNKRKYIACYQELLDSAPTKQSHILMGEANMRIQEPDAAIRAFEAALALDPEDALLATRVGEALVSTHDYDRAIEYYKTALRASPRKHALRHQLALLYAKLAQHDAAAALLQAAVGDTAADDAGEAGEPAVVAFQRARTLGLLADVHLAHSKRDAEEGRRSARVACPPAKEALERAQAVATRALRHLQAGGLASSDRQLEARELAASACYKLGVYSATNEKDDENAVAQCVFFPAAPHKYPDAALPCNLTHMTCRPVPVSLSLVLSGRYTLALQHDEAHEAAMLALAKACVAAGRMEEGREQCLRLLKMSDAHIDAASLLADIMLQEGNLDQATLHFQRILEKRPAEWQSLSRVTLLLWRTGCVARASARACPGRAAVYSR
jgi:tetratricopeptide repeat protein 21B